MKPEDFSYALPPGLVAQQPLAERGASRLLCLHGDGTTADLVFPDLARLLRPGDLLVVNDTRVIPARVLGAKRSGGRVEMLVERVLGERLALVQLRSSHAPRPGTWLDFGSDAARMCERRGPFFVLEFAAPVMAVLERSGHVPLPPYIRRTDTDADRQRYQTLFARHPGAVAAPTAGLHFDAALLARLAALGVGVASVTLHVGAGTFAPLRPEQLSAGRLHAERVEVTAATVSAIAAARATGGRIVAVGTTVVRALETAAREGTLAPYAGETELFIRPGYRFHAVDALVTNFHLPQSSLLMLVCAFGGTPAVLAAYRHAVQERYRFFSYGDAMFLERRQLPGEGA
ncbi:S-adenosylmethionine:tRNA ribosyltransferase-isomerase [Gammaproteobacteria bacterium]|nr:tRNA preQ1(34) S-adenosylmethionine ribosyltransferase-isomerase QueA [Gammaproteobacteria bacterium]MCZ7654526.1 tRNA preQ1(34) S-adenosylmethionine ribosyltransferase-isomerase QueA [Rhodocyclaceae bacterium]CAG0938650.1 S-adenosylmethionine:tRNA ribosyltransferase-isomerase [Gammaproteobacteria bacterium]